jgi:hypothetical protein
MKKLINTIEKKHLELEKLLEELEQELKNYCKDFTPHFQHIPGDGWCICCIETDSNIQLQHFLKLIEKDKELTLEKIEYNRDWWL